MLEFKLSKDYEQVSKANPFGLKYTPLKHQYETYQALQENEIVMNLHNTGTGKTLASLLYLFDLKQKRDNVLFIAPTNELIYQHSQDIKEFIADNNLKFNVIRIDAQVLTRLTTNTNRNGDKLHQLLENPVKFDEELNLNFEDQSYPFVFVTNPDIFYYGLYFQYGKIDQRNLCQDFATLFSYIVIDEFHYYNPKQFSNFLFFFALSKEFGYFNEGRKICLLSATPAQYIIDYLDKLELDMEIIDFEVAKASNKLQTLTRAEVKLVAGNLTDRLDLVKEEAITYLEEGLDGVIIGNSLVRINKSFTEINWQDKERITGPQSRQAREEANGKSLILATPTVDIGYNFVKADKERQNIDFVILEAKSLDELLQRIGRAGRVLGKKEKDQISKLLILVDDNSYSGLKEELEEGKEYQRNEFARLLEDINLPPQKREFIRYINSYALLESFYPLYRMFCSMAKEDQEYIKELFNLLKQVFESNKNFNKLLGITRKFEHQKRVVEESESITKQDYQDFCYWFDNRSYSDNQIRKLMKSAKMKDSVTQFVKQEYNIKKSLFSFRDSFNGPQAAIYDPKNIFVADKVSSYGLLHIVRNYNYSLYDSKEKFKQDTGSNREAAFYVKLHKFREEKLNLSYKIDPPANLESLSNFEEKICNRPTALTGIEIIGGEALRPAIKNYFKDKFIPILIVTPELNPTLYSNLQNSLIYPIKLEVNFYRPKVYRAILGTAAFLVYPELQGAIYASKNQREEMPIII